MLKRISAVCAHPLIMLFLELTKKILKNKGLITPSPKERYAMLLPLRLLFHGKHLVLFFDFTANISSYYTNLCVLGYISFQVRFLEQHGSWMDPDASLTRLVGFWGTMWLDVPLRSTILVHIQWFEWHQVHDCPGYTVVVPCCFELPPFLAALCCNQKVDRVQ